MGFKRKITVVGSGQIAETVHVKVDAWGQRVERYAGLDLLGAKGLNHTKSLIVETAGLPDMRSTLERVSVLYGEKRKHRQTPLSVLFLTRESLYRTGGPGPTTEGRENIRIRALSIPDRAARLLLSRFPMHASVDPVYVQSVHILIAGFGVLGESIAIHAMRLAQYGTGKPRLTIADRDPERCRTRLLDAFPEARRVAEIQFKDVEYLEPNSDNPYTLVYVCFENDSKTQGYVEPLKETLRQKQNNSPPLFIHFTKILDTHCINRWDGQSFPYSATDIVCNPEVLFCDQGDELASIIHEYYRDSIVAQGRSLKATPAGQPWETLAESYRQASRNQADHLPAKLARIECRCVPEEASEYFVFYPQEVETLSMIEHDRWSADRYLDGWTYGATRDNTLKVHPELVPYDQLTVDMKDLDRYAVRLIPALLARQGLSIKRDLIVALVSEGAGTESPRTYKRQITAVLVRLCERFPDRTLVLAVDLCDRLQRLLVRSALDEFGARLRVLMHGPVQDAMEAFNSGKDRRDYLELIGRCEQRIQLGGPEEIQKWLLARAGMWIIIGKGALSLNAQYQGFSAQSSDGGSRRRIPLRQVLVDPVSGEIEWGFEY